MKEERYEKIVKYEDYNLPSPVLVFLMLYFIVSFKVFSDFGVLGTQMNLMLSLSVSSVMLLCLSISALVIQLMGRKVYWRKIK